MESLLKLIDSRKKIVIDKARIISVNGSVAKVESLTTGKTFFKCSLNAVIDNDTSEMKIEPEAGSVVVIAIIEESATIIQTSKVKSFNVKIDTTEFKLSKDGFEMMRNGENLKTILNDLQDAQMSLCDSVNQIVVSPGYGTTPNVPVITQIKKKINLTKTRINKVLK